MNKIDFINEHLYRKLLAIGLDGGDAGQLADKFTNRAVYLLEREDKPLDMALAVVLKDTFLQP